MERFYLARIEAGRVAQVIVAPARDFPATAKLDGQWRDVTQESPRPGEGWGYDGARYTPPDEA